MYNATSELVGTLSAAATRYAASTSASASMYAADQALTRQIQQQSYNDSHPYNGWSTIMSLLNTGARAAGFTDASDMVAGVVKNLVKSDKSTSTPWYKSSGIPGTSSSSFFNR